MSSQHKVVCGGSEARFESDMELSVSSPLKFISKASLFFLNGATVGMKGTVKGERLGREDQQKQSAEGIELQQA